MMGKQMKSRFDGNCKVCGSSWKSGTDIYYQNDPKIICSNKECYSEQGGTITASPPYPEYAGKLSVSRGRTTEQKIADLVVFDEQIFKLAMSRLVQLENIMGNIPIEQKLVFLESWARTIASSYNQR